MVVLKNFFVVLLVVSFVVSVMTFGSGRVFSSSVYFEGIVNGVKEIPDIQGLVEIWRVSEEPDFGYSGTGGGAGGGSGHAGGRGRETQEGFWNKASAFFESVGKFFAAIGTFFSNLWESVMYIVKILVGVFAMVPKFMPWNATVPIL